MMFRTFALIILLTGCVSTLPPRERTFKTQERSTVELAIWCDGVRLPSRTASGVIVDQMHVLTAYHAVECPRVPVIRSLIDGVPYAMVVIKTDTKADLALLSLPTSSVFTFAVRPPVIGIATPGDYACSSVAYPVAGWSCGYISKIIDRPKGGIVIDAYTVGGNSGSALYNERGQLIGIVVAKVQCPGLKVDGCTGTATSLYDKIAFYPDN